MLNEDKRKQLDGIVNTMIQNKEPDSNINLVVNDFKSKYDQDGGEETKGVLDAFIKGFKNVGTSIKESGEAINPILENQNISSGGKVAGVTGKLLKPFAQIGAEVVATPLRAGGEVIQNVTGKDINEGTSDILGKLIQKGMDTNTAQKAVKAYEELKQTNPEAANAIGATLDIADFATLAAGGAKVGQLGFRGAEATGKGIVDTLAKGAKQIASTGERAGDFTDMVKNIGSGAIKKAGEFTGKTEVATDDAVKSFKENLLNQIEGKSSSIKKLDKTRTDILDTIAKNPNYHPEIDIENKAFNVSKSLQNMESDISSYSEKLGELFSKVDETAGGVNLNSIVKNISEKILTEKNIPKLVVSGGQKSPFVNDVKKLISNIRESYGDTISRSDAWEIRKQIDNSINSISDTNIQKSLRQDLRKAFAESLETSIPNDIKGLVKNGMSEVSKIIEARDYTRDVLNGFKIKGGKLTDIIRNSVGTNIGQVAGAGVGGAFGSLPGAAIGYVASNKLGEWLAKNTLTNSSERSALLKILKKQPQAFQDIADYIKSIETKLIK